MGTGHTAFRAKTLREDEEEEQDEEELMNRTRGPTGRKRNLIRFYELLIYPSPHGTWHACNDYA